MLLAGTVDPAGVEFVFTEPEAGQLEGEADGMGRRASSTGSLHSRFGRERAAMRNDSEEAEKRIKYETDRALVSRSLNILDKHKTRGLQKGWNKWKLEVDAAKMGRREKARMATIEEEQKKKDGDQEQKLLKQTIESKQRSAIQLMIDSKRRGKQMQLRAGWNSWKISVAAVKRAEFAKALRSKDNANAMNRITQLFKSSESKKLYVAMNKWRCFILGEIKKGGGESAKYNGVLKQRSALLANRVKELEKTAASLSAELDGLKVNDWARALSAQQKIVANLRKQVGRSERGWAAEAAAFASACTSGTEYSPQAGMGGGGTGGGGAAGGGGKKGGKEVASAGSGLAGVLQQRKLKQQATLKEKVLPAGVRNNSKVRQIQAYIVGKAREIASVRREVEEWRRRAEASGRNWSALAAERDDLSKALDENKDSSVRQSAQLLDMVRERDGRIQKLQSNLVNMAGEGSAKNVGNVGGGITGNNKENKGELKSALKDGGGGGLGEGGGGGGGGKSVRLLTKRQRAAAFLGEEFQAMQAESTSRAQSLVNQLIELRGLKIKGGGRGGGGRGGGGGGGDAQDYAHKCVALTNKVKRLEDELHEVEVQGGVRALVEAQELIEALQSELAVNERKVRVVQAQLRKGGRATDGDEAGALTAHALREGNGGQLSARSNRSTPSQLPTFKANAADQEGIDEAWDLQLSETAQRLEDAEVGYEKELADSGLLRKSVDGSDYGDDEEE